MLSAALKPKFSEFTGKQKIKHQSLYCSVFLLLFQFAADMYEKSYLKEEVDLSNQRQVWMKYVLELSWRKLETDELDRVLKELQNI